MGSKTIAISTELADLLESKRAAHQSWDSLIRSLAGMPQLPVVARKQDTHPDFELLKALKVGQSLLMPFERLEPTRDPDGKISASWNSKDYTPTNLRHLAQVQRRAAEKLGYRFFVEGSPRGQVVTRIA